MRRTFAAILLVAVLLIGGGIVASIAYQAGLSTAVTTAVSQGGAAAPVIVPGYGYGWSAFGPGFGFFGFLGFLLFLFLVFGLIRALAFGGRHRGPWGRHGWGPGGPGDPGPKGGWEGRAQSAFDDWHRRAHDGAETPTDPTRPA